LGDDLGRNFVVALDSPSSKASFLNKASTKLALRDASGTGSPADIPQFTAKTDNTISWDAAGLCLEATGAKSGDAVGVSQCTGRPNQLWTFVPSGHGQSIRLKDTEKCMDVNAYQRGLNGAPIELRECTNGAAETWRMEGPIAMAVTRPAQQVEWPILLCFAAGMLIAMAWKGGVYDQGAMLLGALSGIVTGRAGARAADMNQDNSFLRVDPDADPHAMPFADRRAIFDSPRNISGVTAASNAAVIDPRRSGDVKMIGLFGNSEESRKKRADLSLRSAPPGSRVVTFRKPNAATTGLLLGLKFREGTGKSVFIDKVLPNTEAARLKDQGQLAEGDEVVMCSATFGDELWSSRGVGKYRLEKSIAVRQGMVIKLVLEARGGAEKKRAAAAAKEAERQAKLQNRLQQQLQNEVDSEKKKGFFNW
jgi:hypothetical protein